MYDAIPSSKHLTASNEVFRLFSSRYQCITVLDTHHADCVCGVAAGGARPVSVTHEEYCPLGGGTADRHDAAVYEVAEMLRGSNFPTRIQCEARGSEEQYPDLEVSNFPHPGATALIELSVVCPTQERLVRAAAQQALSAADFREEEKLRKYAQLAAARGDAIYPAVWESTGANGRSLRRIINICAGTISSAQFAETALERTWAASTFTQYWTQRLAISFWRGSLQMARARSRAAAARLEAASARPISQELF